MRIIGNNIIQNTTINLVAEIGNKLLVFMVSIVLTRYLGPENYGQLSLAITLSSFVYLIAEGGTNTLIINKIAQGLESDITYINNSSYLLLTKSILGLITIGIILILYNPDKALTILIFIISGSYIINNIGDFFYAIQKGKKHFKSFSLSTLLKGASLLIFTVIITSYGANLFYVSLAYVSSAIVGVVPALISTKTKHISFRSKKLDGTFLKLTLRESLPYALTILTATIYLNADIIILSKTTSKLDLGNYSLAYSLIIAGYILPASISNTVFPFLSSSISKNFSEGILLFKKNVFWNFFIGLTISSILFLISDHVISNVYGLGFEQSILLFKILILSFLLKFIAFPVANMLISLNLIVNRLKIQIITAILNIILNIILIPRYGVISAAVTTVISEFTLCFGYYLVLKLNVRKF